MFHKFKLKAIIDTTDLLFSRIKNIIPYIEKENWEAFLEIDFNELKEQLFEMLYPSSQEWSLLSRRIYETNRKVHSKMYHELLPLYRKMNFQLLPKKFTIEWKNIQEEKIKLFNNICNEYQTLYKLCEKYKNDKSVLDCHFIKKNDNNYYYKGKAFTSQIFFDDRHTVFEFKDFILKKQKVRDRYTER